MKLCFFKWRFLIVFRSRLYVGILHNLQSFFDSRLAAMTLYKVYDLGFFVPNVTTMYTIICIMYYTVSDPYYSYVVSQPLKYFYFKFRII